MLCVDKTLHFKFIMPRGGATAYGCGAIFGVALRLLNSQWKIHHCDVLCLVIFSLCSLQAYNYAEHLHNILLYCASY